MKFKESDGFHLQDALHGCRIPGARKTGAAASTAPQKHQRRMIEPDDACGRAMAQWVGCLPDCLCAGVFSTEMAALLTMKRQPVDLALFIRQSNDLAPGKLIKNFQAAAPGTGAFGYRIFGFFSHNNVLYPGSHGSL